MLSDQSVDVVEVNETAHVVALEKGFYEAFVKGKVVETYIDPRRLRIKTGMIIIWEGSDHMVVLN